MIYINTFESFSGSTSIKINKYKVYYYCENNDHYSIYDGINYELAKSHFEDFDTQDIDSDIKGNYNRSDNTYDITVNLDKIICEYNYISSDYDIDDFPIEDHYDDELLYELVSESGYINIETKDVETLYSINVREQKNQIEYINNDIINYVKSITSEYKYAGFLNSSIYFLREYKDGFIMIRISDHFFNIDNIKLGKNVLYNSIPDLHKYDEHRNIYGFISINILDDESSDRRGFRHKYKSWLDYDTNLSYLIDYIDINIDDYNDIKFKNELDYIITSIESNIDIALNDGTLDN